MPYLEYCDTHGEYEGEECPRCEAVNEAALEADRRLDTDKLRDATTAFAAKYERVWAYHEAQLRRKNKANADI